MRFLLFLCSLSEHHYRNGKGLSEEAMREKMISPETARIHIQNIGNSLFISPTFSTL